MPKRKELSIDSLAVSEITQISSTTVHVHSIVAKGHIARVKSPVV